MDAAAYRKLQDESVRLLDEEDFDAAAPLVKESLAAAKRIFGDSHVETADCLYNQGTLERRTGKWKKAIATLERSIAVYEKLGESQRTSVARALADIANVLVQHEDFRAAKPIAERAIAGYRAAGVRDDDYAIALSDLARCELEERRYPEAVAAYEEAMTMLGEDVRSQLFDTKSRWAVELLETDPDRARVLFDEACALAEKLTSSQRVLGLLNVAGCAVLGGRPKDGEAPAKRALEIARRTESPADLAAALFRRGDVHVCLDQHAQAVPLLERAIELQRKLKEEDALTESLRILGIALYETELYARAAVVLEEAVKRLSRTRPDDTDYVDAVEQLAHVRDELEEHERARHLYVKVLDMRARLVPGSADHALAWNNLALHHAFQENWAAADDAFMKGLGVLDRLFGSEHSHTREVIRESAEMLEDDLERCPRFAARTKG